MKMALFLELTSVPGKTQDMGDVNASAPSGAGVKNARQEGAAPAGVKIQVKTRMNNFNPRSFKHKMQLESTKEFTHHHEKTYPPS